MLREKFLKSFEDKISEIDQVRTKEYEELK